MNKLYKIHDWANNPCFDDKGFLSFEDAEDYLCEFLGEDYDEDRQEYYIY